MIIESAIGISVAWLLDRLTDKAKNIDEQRSIRTSVESSIKTAYEAFLEKNPKLAYLIFEDQFLKEHLCPEINKLLSRDQKPNIEKIVANLPPQAVVHEANLHAEVTRLFDIIWNDFKRHEPLQDLIDHRQIEETSAKLDVISSGQDLISQTLKNGLERASIENIKQHQETRELIAEIHRQIMPAVGALNDAMGTGSENVRIDSLLNKQLDRVKTFLNEDKLSEAYELLMDLEEDIGSSDSYTQFRWHANLGAYHLAMGEHSKAAAEFISAHTYAPNDEKACANKIRALLLLNDYQSGIELSETMINKFPQSEQIWALHLNAMKLCNISTDTIKVPDEIKSSASILYIQSELKIDQGEYATAYSLVFQALQTTPESHELKRALLRAALTWATIDNVKAHFYQLSNDVREALGYALKCFGDPVEYLKAIQSPEHFVEASTNLAIASEIIGDKATKSSIVSYAFDRAPDREELLLHKVKDLRSKNDIASLKQITQDKLESLSTEILFLLYESSANSGDLEWSRKLHSELTDRPLYSTQKSELLGVEISALWNADKRDEAIGLINQNASEIADYPPLTALQIRILDESGDNENRDRLLDSLKHSEEWGSSEILQVADILYDYQRYYRAAEFYEILIESPANNYLTKRYISSLIRSDQRSKAQNALRDTPEELVNTPDFRRLKANLAQSCGDLNTLTETLKKELDEFPQDSSIAVWFFSALYRNNELETLKRELSSVPNYSPLIAENEFEIAKYEIAIGFEVNALKRMFKVLQSAPNDPKIAGFYILTILLLKNNDLLTEPEEAIPGSCIVFESNNTQHSVSIQPEELRLDSHNAWPECIDQNSNIAKELIGLKINDSIDLGPGKRHAVVRQLKSIFIFASEKAQEVISKSVSNYGPLWSLDIMDSEGKPDPTEIIESLKSRKAHVESVFEAYRCNKFPLDILAKALGTELMTLILEWPHREYELFVSSGRTEERERIKNLLKRTDKKFVLDLSSLVELHRLGILHNCVYIIGKPIISLSIRDALKKIQILNETQPPSAHANEIDGQLVLEDVPVEFVQERKTFINTLLKFVDEDCEIASVVGPETPSASLAELGDLVSYQAQDAIYLALEHDAVLICEDGALRTLAEEMGVGITSWLQPLMMLLRDEGKLTQEKYSESTLDKLLKKHTFTSIDGRDLLWAAERDSNNVAPQAIETISTFASAQIDLASVIKVGSNFLYLATEKVAPKILKTYFLGLEEALKKGREQYSRVIHDELRSAILAAVQDGTAELGRKVNKAFGDLLSPLPYSPQLKVLPVMIKLALRNQWGQSV